NSVTVSNTTGLIGGKTPDVNTHLNASVVSNNNRAGVTLFASARQRLPFDYDGDGFTEIGKINSKNIGFRGFYRTSSFTKLTVEYHTIAEFRRGGNQLDLPPHEADIAEQTEHNIHCAGLKYDLFLKNSKHWFEIYSSLQHINRQSYYGAGKDPNAYGNTRDLASVTGLQYVLTMKKFLFMPATLTTGFEFNYNALHDEALGYHRVIDQKINIYSLYLQNEWKNAKWSILIGARLDRHNLIKKPIVSPRANVRYSPFSWVSLRAGYASGFRAPQAFDEDLHITAVGGNVSLIQMDPDLKSEKSNSVNLSVDFNKKWHKMALTFLIEGFYTDLNRVFVLEEKGRDQNGNLILERTNGSGAVVAGVNFEGKIIPFKPMEIQFGFTYQQSLYKQPQKWSESVAPQKKMYRSPDTYGFLTFLYTPFTRFNISLSGIYTGSMLVQHFAGYIPEDREEITPSFFDLNLKLSYDIKLQENIILQVNGGIKNIVDSYQKDYDQGEFRDAGYIYGPTLPRTVFVGVKLTI
ncbi:MAG: TonB-dependent receptor, partial [Bacteroidales bacterium]